jgi:hypothetical protein
VGLPAEIPAREGLDQALAAAGERVRIGLCWAGSSQNPRDGKRSMPASALAPLAELPEVAWYSFQFDSGEPPPLPGLVTLGPLLRGFDNTAYALAGMDLVITVDTVTAHLAGALGIPTLLLLSFLPDWRWQLGRDDSPWYPTLRLYRQPLPGAWEPVVRQVLEDLGRGE